MGDKVPKHIYHSIVCKRELLLVIGPVIVAPPRDLAAAGCTAAVSEMQALLEHAPVRLPAKREALRVLKAVRGPSVHTRLCGARV